MLWLRESWISFEKLLRAFAGFLQNLAIAAKIGNPQRRQAMLLRAEQIARAAKLEIHFSELEPVACRGKRIEPSAGLLGKGLIDQQPAEAGKLSATDAA